MTLHILDGLVFIFLGLSYTYVSRENTNRGLYGWDLFGRGFEYLLLILLVVLYYYFIWGDYNIVQFLDKVDIKL